MPPSVRDASSAQIGERADSVARPPSRTAEHFAELVVGNRRPPSPRAAPACPRCRSGRCRSRRARPTDRSTRTAPGRTAACGRGRARSARRSRRRSRRPSSGRRDRPRRTARRLRRRRPSAAPLAGPLTPKGERQKGKKAKGKARKDQRLQGSAPASACAEGSGETSPKHSEGGARAKQTCHKIPTGGAPRRRRTPAADHRRDAGKYEQSAIGR